LPLPAKSSTVLFSVFQTRILFSVLNRRDLLASAAAFSAMPAIAAPSAKQQADALYATIIEELFEEAPEFATSLGVDTGAKSVLRSRLAKRSLAGRQQHKALAASQLSRLETVDRSALTGQDKVNYDAVLYGMKIEDGIARRFDFGQGSTPYTVHQLGGAYSQGPDFLDSQHPVETRADAEAYLARLEAFARVLDEESEVVRHDTGLGVVPPDFALRSALTQMHALRAMAADKSVLTASLVRRTSEKHIEGDWAAKASAIVTAKVYPALDRQIALIENLQKTATHDAGVWKLKDGEAFYAMALEAETTTKLSPAEVHKLGLEVVAECTAASDAIMSANGLTKGSVGMRLRAMFLDPKFRYANTDAAKETLIADLNAKLAEVTKLLPNYFRTLPKAGVQVKRVPKYIESGAPGGYYQNATLDGKRPGTYYINLRDTAEVPSWTLPTLTFHEAIPGHHFQISIAQETDLPLIRRIGGYNAYVEGWALYAEQLAVEMGLYASDPWGHIGQLHDAMLRGVRLVLDTGLHQMRWTREQAVKYYVDTLGDPESGAISEVERYCVWPGQACGYMVGKRFILSQRDRAKAALGPRFDLKAFHDAVLKPGALPLDELAGVIDSLIAGAKA
jgi:uncharacterized protein (DUF885 family)